ncbi:hypothetical protein PORCAN_109 [Porphyromonas crevioricanis JCM 13913]|nr:hypothetical protein PORCAN_109 [Porphyromonas crevioricanis JCM 13913]
MRNFANTGENNIFLRREFLLSPVLIKEPPMSIRRRREKEA